MKNTGILDAEVHKNLIQGIGGVVSRANVPEHYIITSMQGNTTDKDMTWVKGFPRVSQSGKSGYLVQGDNVETRCMYIAGALLRNYIDAVVMPLSSMLEGDPIDPTVLIIPNFYSDLGEIKAPPTWKIQQMYDFLIHRITSGKQTVLGVSSVKSMTSTYGNLLSSHIQATYFGVGQ